MKKATKFISATLATLVVVASFATTAGAKPLKHRDHRDGAAVAAGIATVLILDALRDRPHDRARPWANRHCRVLRHRCDDGNRRACRKFRQQCTYKRPLRHR